MYDTQIMRTSRELYPSMTNWTWRITRDLAGSMRTNSASGRRCRALCGPVSHGLWPIRVAHILSHPGYLLQKCPWARPGPAMNKYGRCCKDHHAQRAVTESSNLSIIYFTTDLHSIPIKSSKTNVSLVDGRSVSSEALPPPWIHVDETLWCLSVSRLQQV